MRINRIITVRVILALFLSIEICLNAIEKIIFSYILFQFLILLDFSIHLHRVHRLIQHSHISGSSRDEVSVASQVALQLLVEGSGISFRFFLEESHRRAIPKGLSEPERHGETGSLGSRGCHPGPGSGA